MLTLILWQQDSLQYQSGALDYDGNSLKIKVYLLIRHSRFS